MAKRKQLQSFADSSPNIDKEARAALLDSDADEGGIDTGTSGDTANWDFSNGGFDPNGSYGVTFDYSDFMSAGDITAMMGSGGFHIQYELARGFNKDDNPFTGVKYLIGARGPAAGWHQFTQSSGTFVFKLFQNPGTGSGTGNESTAIDHRSLAIDGDFTKIDYWRKDDVEYTAIDNLLVFKSQALALTAESNEMVVGGLTQTGASDLEGYPIKNFQLNKVGKDITTDKYRILFLGDSVTCKGGADGDFSGESVGFSATSVKLPWVPTNTADGAGYDSDGTTPFTAVKAAGTQGQQATFFRELGKKGIFPWDDNRNYAQSGGRIDDASTQVAGITGYVPTHVVCNLGVNDTAQNVAEATTESRYHTLIDDLYNLGAEKVYVVQFTTLEENTLYQTTAFRELTEANHAMIAGLPSWAKAQGYGDFVKYIPTPSSLSSWENYDTSLFPSGDLHPNEDGDFYLGQSIGKAVANDIAATAGAGVTGIISNSVITR